MTSQNQQNKAKQVTAQRKKLAAALRDNLKKRKAQAREQAKAETAKPTEA